MSRHITNEQLLSTYSSEYLPTASPLWSSFAANRPVFTINHVREMLPDPRIQYGLWLLKGPITSARPVCKVNCANERIRKFIIQIIQRFWLTSATRALRAIEWGFSPHEIIYKQGPDGLIYFHNLRDFHPNDVEIWSRAGRFCGFQIKKRNYNTPNFLITPKAFVHTHSRDINPYYGQSRLFSAYVPWWEKWGVGGYRDIRRLWYFKCAYNGGVIFYPPGSTKNEHGIPVPNRILAQEIVEKIRSGGVLALPASLADAGAPSWDYKPPESNPSPTGLLEYGEQLDDEELEAMGIPPEVISSGGDQGFGSSTGRQVPQTAFYATLQELLQWLLHDLDEQIIQFLVRWNFGQVDYEIIPFLLDPSANNNQSGGDFGGNQFIDEDQRAFPAGEQPRSGSQGGVQPPPPKKKAA